MQEFFLEHDTLVLWLLSLLLFALFGLPYWLKRWRAQKHTAVQDIRAERYGLKEPVSLYPRVNPELCIGSAGCIAACPETDVLGLRNGQAIAVNTAHCVGHGLCERSCPVDAITLVFGTAKRGLELPRIKENFETNIDHLYIVGELGGMGLVRNAFEQGRQCLEYLTKSGYTKQAPDSEYLDILIVGSGPAGLSASIHAKQAGYNFLTLEREDIGGAVRYYPRKKLVMTRPFKVPNFGKLNKTEILKEELIDLWDQFVDSNHIRDQILTYHSVDSIERSVDGFQVTSGEKRFKSKHVVLAIGRRGTPRKLDIPGEDLENVAYSLLEPEHFAGEKVTVVGGGDSAVEAALSLSDQPNTHVKLSYRKDKFTRIKPMNMERLHDAVHEKRIELLLETEVVKNSLTQVEIKFSDGRVECVENNSLFIFAGGILPTAFLKDIGVKIDMKFGEPR